MTQLALIIDLNVCVGCSACVTSCKEWNTSGPAGFMSDDNPYQKDPTGTFFNRVQTYEVGEFPCTAKNRLVCLCAQPVPAISANKMALF